MARGGTATTTKKSHGWPSQSDKLLGWGYSWFSVVIAICCICSSVYVLQLVFVNGRNCGAASLHTISSALSQLPATLPPPPKPTSTTNNNATPPLAYSAAPNSSNTATTDLSRIVFGIAAAAKNWPKRKEYIKQWWAPHKNRLRAIVWLDKAVNDDSSWGDDVPPFRISGDTSRFEYSYHGGRRSAIRVSRVVGETFRLGLADVDWFVMGDDDTFFFPDNLAKVLAKYDPRQMHYIGSNSESHLQNLLFSYNMAFGGGGFAISFPLAKELAAMQDACLARYPQLFGSDDRMHACMSELGVSLSKEPGFHQMDINGDALGLLAAHPLTPLVSIHHLDVIHPIFPNRTRAGALAHLLRAAALEPASLLQQSICYAGAPDWSFSVSWGFVVQVHREFLTPRVLETPVRTFHSCRRKPDKAEFPFNTREPPKDLCQRPSLYYMASARAAGGLLETVYAKEDDTRKRKMCDHKLQPLSAIQRIRVLKEPVQDSWFQAPRRSCCRVTAWRTDTIEMHVGACRDGEGITGRFQ